MRGLVRSGRHKRIIVVIVVLEWVPVPVAVEVRLGHVYYNLGRDKQTNKVKNLVISKVDQST